MVDRRYRVVEKSSKQDEQGNMHGELWLKDEIGGFSLLRLQPNVIDRFNLGDEVVLAIALAKESTSCSAIALEVNHV